MSKTLLMFAVSALLLTVPAAADESGATFPPVEVLSPAEPASAPDLGAEDPIELQTGLTCSLSVTGSSCQGDKTKHTFSASGSGCIGPYDFSWSGATRTSPSSTTNPNQAIRWLTPGSPCSAQVCVTVTANGLQCQRCRTIYHGCDPNCEILP